MVKLIKIAKTKTMLKVEIEGKEEWTNTSEAVYNYVKSQIPEGSNIEIQYEQKGTMKFVNRVNKLGQSTSTPTKTDSSPSSSSASTQDSIVRQSVLRSAVIATQAITGQIDANALGDYVLVLYKKFLEEIK